MSDKRHLVLYGLGALILLVLAAMLVFGGPGRVSETVPEAVTTTTGTTLATSTRLTQEQKDVSILKPFQYEIASSEAARTRGLSGRTNIRSDYGMLFVFPNKDRHGFWMKDMLEPIDIIWISDARTVVGVEANVSPQTYPNVFYPPEPVRYVLETRAGEAARLGLLPGTRLNLPLPYGE